MRSSKQSNIGVKSIEAQPNSLHSSTDSVIKLSILKVNHVRTSWFEPIRCGNVDIVFKLDTGSDVNVIPWKEFKKLNIPAASLDSVPLSVNAYGGYGLTILGTIKLRCICHGQVCFLEFNVAQEDDDPILSLETCSALGLVKRTQAATIHEMN